jgi:peptide/nickel transport system permease protein
VVAGLMRLLRSGMLEVLDSEYVKLARVKGVVERRVVWVHALKNALIPVVTFAGIYFAILVTTAIVVETVFAWPGLGRLAYEGITSRDFPVIQAVVLTTAAIVAAVNLCVDCPRRDRSAHPPCLVRGLAPVQNGRRAGARQRRTGSGCSRGGASPCPTRGSSSAPGPRLPCSAQHHRGFVLWPLGPDLGPAIRRQSLRKRFKRRSGRAGSWATPRTDRLGRDMLARIIWGARVSLAAGVVTVLLASAFGAAVGLVAGYYGGRVDIALMRFTDATMSFPVILLALILAVTVGPSFTNVVVAIAVILWARYARVIRAQVLTLMQLDFIAQSRIAGAGGWRIITRHLFPNTLNTLVVLVTLQIGYVIIVEASLSFLGAGIPPPTPAWGSMIAEGREFVTSAWWVSGLPGIAILLVVLAFNLLGDWLRDTLDPKLRQL